MRKLIHIGLLLLCPWMKAQVSVSIGTTVLNASPSKSGRNIGTQNPYETGQVYKNVLCNGQNCGNEPYSQMQIWQIQGGSPAPTLSTTQAQSNINNSDFDSVTANFWAGGSIEIIDQTAAPGSDVLCSKTISSNTVAGSSPRGAVYTFPACVAAPTVGQLFKVAKQIPGTPNYFCSGSGTCSFQTSDVCAACGTQTMKWDATAGSIAGQWIFDNASQNEFVLINGGTWTFSQWAKATAGTPTISINLSRSGGFSCSFTENLTTTWTQYTHTCTPTETGTGTPSGWNVAWSIPSGSVVLTDNPDFERTSGGDGTNTSIFSDGYVAGWRDFLQNSAGVTQAPCRYGPHPASSSIADLIQTSQYNHVLSDPGIHDYAGGGIQMLGYKQFFEFAQLVGCKPYLILPITMDVSEAATLVNWIHTNGWDAVFSEIPMELGNENWNIGTFTGFALGFNISSPSDTNYYDFMKRSGQIFSAIRTAATSAGVTNIKLMVGVQDAVVPGTPITTIGYAKPDRILLNGYTQNDGMTSTGTTAALWLPAMTQPVEMVTNNSSGSGFKQSLNGLQGITACGAAGSTACEIGVYEENNSTYAGSITQAALDGFGDGQGYGVITAQQIMQQKLAGANFANLFASQQYYFSGNGFNVHIFGDVIDYGGATARLNSIPYTPRPTFLGAELANKATIGPMVQTTLTGPDACNLGSTSNGVAATNAPCEFAYAHTNGSQRTLLLINTDVSNVHTVTFTGTNAPVNGSTVTQTRLSSTNINDKNEASNLAATNTTAQVVGLTVTSLISFNPATSFSLPAHSATLLSYSLAIGPMASVYIQNEANGWDNGYPMPLLPGAEWRMYAQPIYEQNNVTAWTSDGTTTTFTNSGTNALVVGDGFLYRDFPSIPDNFCKVTAVTDSTHFQTRQDACSSGGATYLASGSGSATPSYYQKKEGAGMDPTGTWEIINTGTTPVKGFIQDEAKVTTASGSPCTPDLHTSTCYTAHPILTNAQPSAFFQLDPSLTPTCGKTGSIQTHDLVFFSDITFDIKFTTNQDTSKSGLHHYILCQVGAGSGKLAVVESVQGYEQIFPGDDLPLYFTVFANADPYVNYSMTSDSGTGNATLETFAAPVGEGLLKNGGKLPQAIFHPGTSNTTYTITISSDADPTATTHAVVRVDNVSGRPLANTYKMGYPGCEVDPRMTSAGGVTYDIGPGQIYPDWTTVPTNNFPWGSTFIMHGESAPNGSPMTLANYFELKVPNNYASFTTNDTVPAFYVCGKPNHTTGEYPVLEASNATSSVNCGSFTCLGNMVTVNGIPASLPNPDKFTTALPPIHNYGIAGIKIQNNRPGFNFYPPGTTSGPQNAWGAGSAIRPFAVGNYTVYGVYSFNNANMTISDCNAQAGWVRGCTQNARITRSHMAAYGIAGQSTEHAVYMQDWHSVADHNLEDGSKSDQATGGFSMRGFRSWYIGNFVNCQSPYNCPNGWGGNSENQDAHCLLEINCAFGPTATWDGTSCSDGTQDYPWCSDLAHPGEAQGGVSGFAAFSTEHFFSFFMTGNGLKSLLGQPQNGCQLSISQNHGDNGLEMQHNIYYSFNTNDCPNAEANTGAGMFEDVRPTQSPIGNSVQPIDWPAAVWVNNVNWWNENVSGAGFRSSFGRGTAHAIFRSNMFHVDQFTPTQTNIPLAYGAASFNASQYGLFQGTSPDQFTGMYPVEAKQGGWGVSTQFKTSTTKPYNATTLAPLTGSAMIGIATPLSYPALLYPPMFNMVDASGNIVRRIDLTTVGAQDPPPSGPITLKFSGPTKLNGTVKVMVP